HRSTRVHEHETDHRSRGEIIERSAKEMNPARLRRNQISRDLAQSTRRSQSCENPKSEYRNPKQTMRQTNPKCQIIQTSESARFEFFSRSFELFRVSRFEFKFDT